ncbi:MAG: SpoIVB peptidase [bacterium]|nr:SpoIVB peptidase [bacterium]
MKVIWGPRRKRLCGWALSFLTAAVLLSEPVQSLSALPDEIRLTEGYDAHVALSPLASASLEAEQAALVSHDQTLGEVTIAGRQAGSATMTVRLLGVVPIKQVSVRVEEEKVLVPGGQAVGVAIRTAGVLVVGASDLGGGEASPAREAGVRAGDLITAVDGEPVNEAERLSELVNGDAERRLTLNRAGQELSVSVRPRQDARDQAYRLGVWVRDSTAGVGTLSFYDPATGAFGALGHAITDLDTGVILPVSHGEVLPGSVSGVRRGEKGRAGELVSQISLDAPALGEITSNGERGIYGTLYHALTNPLYPEGVSVLHRSEVRLGPAQILSTVDGGGVKAYDVEIVKVSEPSASAQRTLVLRITDDELLEKTGGIVQGMSGSPILQNGKLVGAVTHVLVNDPTRGYGIFIENMLDAAG